MRLRRFNETESYNLSFDGFKDIMSDVTDDLNCEFKFSLYDEKDDPIKYYECIIDLRIGYSLSPDDVPCLDYNFLDEREGGIPDKDDPKTFEFQEVQEWINKIENENNGLLQLKSKVDSQVEKNKEIGSILVKINNLQNRFKSFDNLDSCKMGFDPYNGSISIYFDIK